MMGQMVPVVVAVSLMRLKTMRMILMCQEAFRSVMEYFKDNSQYDYCNNKFIRDARFSN